MNEEVQVMEQTEGKPVVAVLFGVAYAVAGLAFLWLTGAFG